MLDLPKTYPANLVSLSLKQRRAIEEDKVRWLKAVELFRQGKTSVIVSFLRSLQEGGYKEDMRRRFNHLKENRKG